MNKKLTLLLALLPFISPLQAGLWDNIKSVFVSPEKPKPPQIKVLVAHDVDAVMLEVKGKHSIFDPYKHEHLSTHFSNKAGIIHAIPSGIKWGEEFPGVYQVRVVPENRHSLIYVDGTPYRGSIVVYDVGGTISVVNEVDIEEYLRSTMTGKTAAVRSDEALAAMIIASRTQAYYQAMTSNNPYWHVDANHAGYSGHQADVDDKLVDSIASTRYMIMSQTGTYEGVVTPFPIDISYGKASDKRGKIRAISSSEAEGLAQSGENAARILNRKFPNATIELSHNPAGQQQGKNVAEVRNGPKSRSHR